MVREGPSVQVTFKQGDKLGVKLLAQEVCQGEGIPGKEISLTLSQGRKELGTFEEPHGGQCGLNIASEVALDEIIDPSYIVF